MNSSSGRKQFDHLIKLIIIGDSSVGKSCILLRFSEDNFPQSHMPTIGKFYLTGFSAIKKYSVSPQVQANFQRKEKNKQK